MKYLYELKGAKKDLDENGDGTISIYNNDILESISEIKNFKKNGSHTFFSNNGQISYVCHLKDNIMHGEAITYYYNGVIASIKPYDNGLLNGDAIIFYPNGLPKVKTTMGGGLKNGEHILFGRHGEKMIHEFYVDDVLHGESFCKFRECERALYINGELSPIDITALDRKDKFLLGIKEGVRWISDDL